MTQQQTLIRPPRRFSQTLPVTLTQAELAKTAKEIGAAQREKQDLEGRAKVAAEQWKDKIRGIESRIVEHCQKADSGVEDRAIECVEEYLYQLGEVRVSRVDTGAVVSSRAMTAAERQVPLPGTEDPPGKVREKLDAVPGKAIATDIEDPASVLGPVMAALANGANGTVKKRGRKKN